MDICCFQVKAQHLQIVRIFERKEAMVQRCSVKRCSKNIRKIYRKTPVPESFLKKRLRHRYFPENFVKFLGTSFLHRHFLVNFGKFLRTPFFYRAPLVAASERKY